MSEAFGQILESLTANGAVTRDVRQDHFIATCPAHEDKNPSLGVDDKGDRVMLCCYAGCHTDDVVAALGMTLSDLFDGDLDSADKPRNQLVRSYLYELATGQPWFYVDRYYPKTFRQRLPEVEPVRDLASRSDASRLGLRSRPPILFNMPQVFRAMKRGGAEVWWLDGEKDVETAKRHGLVATCPPGFAKWDANYANFLRDADSIVMVVDQDKEKPDGSLGAGHANAITARMGFRSVGLKVRVVAPAAGKDLSDHFAAGYGAEDFTPEPVIYARPRGMNAVDLMTKEFEPITYAVDKILPAGLTICAGSPKAGKALALDTPILTTDGWTTIGEVKTGQQVYAHDGTPTEVVATTEVMQDRPCYRITTRTGAVLVADAEHQWRVHQRRHTRILTTEEILNTTGRRWLLPVAEATQSPEVHLPVDPWVLGYWLANGCHVNGELSCHPKDRDEVIERVTSAGYAVGRVTNYTVSVLGLAPQLRDLDLLGNKHIPQTYLLAGTRQRRSLLIGLCDGDSYTMTRENGSGALELTQVKRDLIDGGAFLARSLGFKVSVHEGRASLNGRDMGPKYRMQVVVSRGNAPVSFSRRLTALPVREVSRRSRRDAIASVEKIPSVPVRCIQVAHPDGTYLAGLELTVTHNSFIGLDLCLAVAAGGPALSAIGTTQGSALYLAREDTYRRLQSRCSLLMGGMEVPRGLELIPSEHDWPGGEEGIANLEEWAEEAGDPRLVVIDTLAKVEPEMGESARTGAYVGNYTMMARYKAWADLHDIAVLMIHHDRKSAAGSRPEQGMAADPFTRISGTRGLTGAADTLWFLETIRGEREGFLHVTGRDVAEQTVDLIRSGPMWTAMHLPE